MAPEFKACSIDGCNGNAHWRVNGRREWCSAHYQRWKTHGDPLAGGTPIGEPERFLRETVFHYEGDECLIWPFSRDSNGRGQIRYNGRLRIVSRIVCTEAHGPAPNLDAAHSCGNGHLGCVTKRHLSWKTPKGNKADELIHGTRIRGERHTSAKLTENDVLAIRALQGRLLQREIAAQFGVTAQTVSSIHKKRKWGWLLSAE